MVENHTSNEFAEIWAKLNRNQRRYVVAIQEFPTKKDAANAIGLRPRTVYQWPDYVDQAVEMLAKDLMQGAQAELKTAVVKAALIKTGALDENDSRTRQDAATEILDRVLGKPTQRSEVGNLDGGALEVLVRYAND